MNSQNIHHREKQDYSKQPQKRFGYISHSNQKVYPQQKLFKQGMLDDVYQQSDIYSNSDVVMQSKEEQMNEYRGHPRQKLFQAKQVIQTPIRQQYKQPRRNNYKLNQSPRNQNYNQKPAKGPQQFSFIKKYQTEMKVSFNKQERSDNYVQEKQRQKIGKQSRPRLNDFDKNNYDKQQWNIMRKYAQPPKNQKNKNPSSLFFNNYEKNIKKKQWIEDQIKFQEEKAENLKQTRLANTQKNYLQWHKDNYQQRKGFWCCTKKKKSKNIVLTDFQKVVYEQMCNDENHEAQKPKYLTWKRVLARIVNREVMSNQSLDRTKEDKLKQFLVRRMERKKRLRNVSEDIKRLYKVLQLPVGLEFKTKKKMSQSEELMKAQMDSDDLQNVNKYIIFPNSSFRRRWDIIIILFVIFNVVMLPMDIGLDFDSSGSFRTNLDLFIDICFALDIILNFFTGYIDFNNKLVMKQELIVKRYLSLWFWVDILATFPFETLLFLFPNSADAKSSLKLLQFLKTPRLLRLGRILKFLENMKGANIMRIVKLFILFFMLAHWVGSFWFIIANNEEHQQQFQGLFIEKYVFALFNGLLILVGESIESYRSSERVFIIICMMIGQAISATIFGSMASLIKNMDQGHDMFTSKMDYINEHLRYYNIPDEISEDIRQYYDYIWLRHRELIYGKKHFEHLSKKLEQGIQKHRYHHIIRSIDFCKSVNDTFLSQFLVLLKPQIATPGEVLFYEGEISKAFYILEKGQIELFQLSNKKLFKKVDPINYIGLEVLMTKTARHWCTALTRSYSDLHIIERISFEKLLNDYPKISDKLRRKAITIMEEFRVLTNEERFALISKHSSKSVGKYYETTYTRSNIFVKLLWSSNDRKLQQALQAIKMFKGGLKMADSRGRSNTQQYKIKVNRQSVSIKRIPKSEQILGDTEPRLTKKRFQDQSDSEEEEDVFEVASKKQVQLFNTGIGQLLNQSMLMQSEFLSCKVDQIFQLFEQRIARIEKVNYKKGQKDFGGM